MSPPRKKTRHQYRSDRTVSKSVNDMTLSDDLEAPDIPEDNVRKTRSRAAAASLPTSTDPKSTATARAIMQKPIDPMKLPTVISCFCSDSLVTRELMFNFARIPTIEAVKALVNKYFAWEFLRLNLPTTLKFLGLNCFYPNKPRDPDGDEYFAISTEEEYKQWYGEVAGAKAVTCQIVRIQVCLLTEEMLEEGKTFDDWFDKDPARRICGPEWKLEEMEKQFEKRVDNKTLIDPRIFGVGPDDDQVITIPSHAWRGAMEKARQYDRLDDINLKLVKEEKTQRQKVKTLLADQADELRGLRSLLRENGISFTSDDVEDPILYDRVVQRDPPHADGKLTAARAVAIEEGRRARARFEKGQAETEEDGDNARDVEMQGRLEDEFVGSGDEFHEAWVI